MLRRWNDNFRVPFVPHTWQFKQGGKESDDERIILPRILASSVDMATACQPFDGRLGLAVPGYVSFRCDGACLTLGVSASRGLGKLVAKSGTKS